MMLSAAVGISDDGERWPHLKLIGKTDNNLNDLSILDETKATKNSTSLDDSTNVEENDIKCEEIKFNGRILKKRVSFPTDQMKLVSHFVEPVSEEISDLDASSQSLVTAYITSCQRNETTPQSMIIEQLKKIDLNTTRTGNLSLRGLPLDCHDCDSLEDLLKTLRLKLLDVGASHSSEEGLIALFDMIEFYEVACHVSIAANKNMSSRGWQACCQMIKRTECLEELDAAQVGLSEHSSTLLARALRTNSHLRVLHLNECNITGRPLSTLVSALKMNDHLRELYLADNRLTPYDALQLTMLLTGNKTLQIIDLRNNQILDKGLIYLCDALTDNCELNALTVWNNGISKFSAHALAKVLAVNQSLHTLNLGRNMLGDEGLIGLVPNGLDRNRCLLHLGLQENQLTCSSIISLAGCLATGTNLRRIDLRKNNLQLAGLMALHATLKLCPTITCLDLNIGVTDDDKYFEEYTRLQKEIDDLCKQHAANVDYSPQGCNGDTLDHEEGELMRKSSGLTRKASLTCSIPPNQASSTPMLCIGGNETITEEQANQERRKMRSPCPSPLLSPLPSPCSRFKVTRVQQVDSPLPSPRSRFTVTPVEDEPAPVPKVTFSPCTNGTHLTGCSSNDVSDSGPDRANVILSAPSKVVVGFDVMTDRAIST